MFEHDEASVRAYLDDLRNAGFDLSRPLPLEHYVHFAVAAAGHAAAEELRRDGFETDLEPDEERGGWVAYVVRRGPAEPGWILRARDRVAGVAAAHAGAYEGWNLVPGEDEPDPADFE